MISIMISLTFRRCYGTNFDVTVTSICSLVKLMHSLTKRFSSTLLYSCDRTPKQACKHKNPCTELRNSKQLH